MQNSENDHFLAESTYQEQLALDLNPLCRYSCELQNKNKK